MKKIKKFITMLSLVAIVLTTAFVGTTPAHAIIDDNGNFIGYKDGNIHSITYVFPEIIDYIYDKEKYYPNGNMMMMKNCYSWSRVYGPYKEKLVELFCAKGYVYKGAYYEPTYKTRCKAIGEDPKHWDGGTVKLYCKMDPIKYNIKFNGNGATSGSMTSMSKLKYDKKYSAKNKFKKTGYTFVGWNTKKDGSGKSFGTSIKNVTSTNGKTVTLYAQWKKNKFTVKFIDRANKIIGVKKIEAVYNKSFSIPSYNKTFEGQKLIGWCKNDTGKGTIYKPGESIKLKEKNGSTIEYFSIWGPISYNISFNSNGGKGSMNNMTNLIYDKAYVIDNCLFTKSGYTFSIWNTKPDGTGMNVDPNDMDGYDGNNFKINKDNSTLKLYAIWKKA